MMSFYKRSFHSFLGLTAGGSSAGDMSPEGGETLPCKCGLGLINSMNSPGYDDICGRGSPHIIESSIAGVSLRSPERRVSSGIGFLEEVDRLMLCTESLGFESYNERRRVDVVVVDQIESMMMCHEAEEREKSAPATSSYAVTEVEAATKRRRTKENVAAREMAQRSKTFPPPLSSLDGGGKWWFYHRQVRKDGRLEITRVMIQRPEILRATRENGRLRLHLVDSDYNFQESVDSEDECDDQECGMDLDTSIMEHRREIDEDDDDDGDLNDDNDSVTNQSLTRQREIGEDGDLSRENPDDIVDLSVTRYCENVDHMDKDLENHSIDDDDDIDGCDHCSDDCGDDEEWRHKTCHEFVMSGEHHNHENHHHHHHHPYHQYHHNHNMQFWSQRYVTTR